MREQTCEGTNPRSATRRGTRGKDPLAWSGCESPGRRGSGTPRKETRRRNDPVRAAESQRRRSEKVGSVVSVMTRLHRPHPHGRSKTIEMRSNRPSTRRRGDAKAQTTDSTGTPLSCASDIREHHRSDSARRKTARTTARRNGPGHDARAATGGNVEAGSSGGRPGARR